MKTSVVLCCYNGENYIEEQLDSLRLQTRVPDEVCIIDDCSKDGTVDKVQAYIKKYQLKHWFLIKNVQNKGWKQNFIEGMLQASGDIIFPCDQDDIWDKMKIEKMSNIMENDPRVLVLAANYTTYYEGEKYRKVSNLFTKSMKFDERYEKIIPGNKALYIYRPGCVMATRKSLVELAVKYKFADYPHDALLWRTALFLDGLYIFNYSSIMFRRHNSNASDAKRHKRSDKLNDIIYYIKVAECLKKMIRDNGDEIYKLQLLDRIIQFMNMRRIFLETGNMKRFLQLCIRYHDYYITKKALLADLYLAVRDGETK